MSFGEGTPDRAMLRDSPEDGMIQATTTELESGHGLKLAWLGESSQRAAAGLARNKLRCLAFLLE